MLKSGNCYEGQFLNNEPNGQGMFSSPEGWRYEGNFSLKDGVFTINGKIIHADGSEETGNWTTNQA